MKNLVIAVCSWPATELYWNIAARYEFPFFVTVVALLVWLLTEWFRPGVEGKVKEIKEPREAFPASKRCLDRTRPFGTIYGKGNGRYEQDGIQFDVDGLELPGFEHVDSVAIQLADAREELIDAEDKVEKQQGQLDEAHAEIRRLNALLLDFEKRMFDVDIAQINSLTAEVSEWKKKALVASNTSNQKIPHKKWIELARIFACGIAMRNGSVSINDIHKYIAGGMLPAPTDKLSMAAVFSKGFVDTGERVMAATETARKKGRRVNVWRLA